MSFEISKHFNILEKSLHFRQIRQDLISSNIANADTPYYRPKDIRFEEALENEIKKQSDELKLATTNKAHIQAKPELDPLKPTIFFRDGHLARNDGNSVDLDVETTEMAKNAINYNATIQAINKEIAMFKNSIDASKNI